MERTFLPDNDPYFELIERAKTCQPAALATIIAAEGSTPQVPGASALFAAEGLVCGTVGGGSVEARVEELARTVLSRKRSFLRSFDLRKELSEEADGVCGGRLQVLIDADPGRNLSAFKDLQLAVKARRAGCLASVIDMEKSGAVGKISRSWLPRNIRSADIRRAGLARYFAEIQDVLRTGQPVLLEEKGRRFFLEPRLPRPRLIVAGAGHVGRAAARMGEFLNFEVIILDDRAEFANPLRFPGAGRILVGDIGRTLKTLPVSADTYIVIVTRGHSQDEQALRACIKRRAGYIGMIGSARKIALVRDRFLNRGWSTEAEWARVHTPIGLRLGSKTVEEIAVSIAAELVLVRRKIREER
jgi:xanthine dehydrogenase accessory factor